MQHPDFQQTLTEIRARFLKRIQLEYPEMRRLLEELKNPQQCAEALKQLLFYVHRYSGNGLTFGFPLISMRAKALEVILDDTIKNASTLSVPTVESAYGALEASLLQALAS